MRLNATIGMRGNLAKKLSAREIKSLTSFLSSPTRPEGTLTFHELQGFLYTVACSPELIMPSDWLPIISNEDDMLYKDLDEAQKVLEQITALYNHINTTVIERSNAMPQGCDFLADLNANFDSEAPISQWSRGFALGDAWLSELWDSYVPDDLSEMSKELSACTMTLSFFGSKRIAEAYYLEGGGRRRHTERKSFEQFAETMRDIFPDALAAYAHLGRTIADVLSARDGSPN